MNLPICSLLCSQSANVLIISSHLPPIQRLPHIRNHRNALYAPGCSQGFQVQKDCPSARRDGTHQSVNG
jgi:hypothetical protein